MASPNYSDSEESFDGFDSDDINNYHDRAIGIGESDIDISSIGSSDDDEMHQVNQTLKVLWKMMMKAMNS